MIEAGTTAPSTPGLTRGDLAALTLPLAHLPGFDPAGLRVWEARTTHSEFNGERRWISVGFTDPTTVGIAVDAQPLRDVPVRRVRLTTIDSATRDRIARWMADQIGDGSACTAPDWLPTERWSSPGVGAYQKAGGYWSLNTRRRFAHFSADGRVGTFVPGLAALDPHDGRTLPDGSRWVDAAALAVVARHLGERGGA